MSVKRGCLEDKGRSGAVALGLFSHRGFSGVTRCSNLHKQLSRYLLKYLRFHGMGRLGDLALRLSQHEGCGAPGLP